MIKLILQQIYSGNFVQNLIRITPVSSKVSFYSGHTVQQSP